MLPTALLRAGLHHSFRLANRRQQGRFLRQRVGHRLFAIDVFARSDRIDGDGYVPVVRRADNDGIDILAVQNLTVIHVLTHFAGKPGLSLGAVWCIDVAHCDDLGALDMLGIADEILPTAAGADGCDADAAVGAPNTPIGRSSDCGSAEKSPPVGSPINGLVGHRDLLPVHHKLLACVKLVPGEPFGLPAGKFNNEQWDERRAELHKRQVIAARLAEKYKAAIVHYQKAFDDACKCAPADYWIWDGIHPTYSGHQPMADEWVSTVNQFWR